MGDKASAKIKLGESVGGGGGDDPTADYINFGSNLDGGNSGNGSNSGEQLGFGGIPLFNQNYMGIPGATYTTIYNRGDNDSPAVGIISSALAAIYNYTGISVGNFTTISNSRGTYYQYQTAGSGIAAANGIGAGSGVVLHFGLLPDDDEANQGGWGNNYRQFQAIVAGEASNFDDATGIGSVLLNRMAVKGVTFDNDNWLYAVSVHHKGRTVAQDIKSSYNAYGGSNYNDVMGMSADALAKSGYALRVAGANEAYDGFMEGFDYSNGAYIWNASSQQYSSHPGFNFNMVTQGVYTITGTLGGTTFMRYTNENKTWP